VIATLGRGAFASRLLRFFTGDPEMNVDLTARERFEYNQRVVQPGDDFKATDLHAKLLVHGGRAAYKTRDAKAEEPVNSEDGTENSEPAAAPAEGSTQDGSRRGRRYRRRDMQADET
jgi:hypothetical protein